MAELLKEKVIRLFNHLENQRTAILAKIEYLSPGQLAMNPEEGKWNMLQVLAHLVKAESLSLKYMERMFSRREELPNAGISSTIRFQLLKWGLNLPIKYKAPAMADTSGQNPAINELMEEWERVRERLNDLINRCDEDCLKKAIYKHPRAGYLNVRQAVEFMSLHIKHHEKQIADLLKIDQQCVNSF